MFWSMKETPRLAVFRRVVGGVNIGVGTVLVVEQACAMAFGLFSQPKPLFFLVGIGLVISGASMVFMKRDSRADQG